MTVQELVSHDDWCELLEIVVREEGRQKWIQGYRIGKDAHLYPYDHRIEYIEGKQKTFYGKDIRFNKGEIDVVTAQNLPMKVIKKDCHNLPDQIGKLKVCSFIPRSVPIFHGEPLFNNGHTLDVNCYPDGYEPVKVEPEPKPKEEPMLEGQTNIFDFIGGANDTD